MMTSWIWILVFPWIQVLAQTCSSSYSQPRSKLQGHVIKAYSDLHTSEQCINKCALHADCHSINYWSSQGICEVNNANHLSNPESMVYSAGCQYLNYFLRAVTTCTSKMCRWPLRCVIDKTKEQGYKCFSCEASGNKVLSYPSGSNKDKVEHKNVVQLTAFTLAMWIQMDRKISRHTPFSYATADKDNEMLVYLNQHTSYFYINSVLLRFSSVVDGRWHSVCATWENVQGNFMVYVDGIKKAGRGNFNKGYIIKKGTVVFGQQTPYDFQGNLTNVNMWDRVFTADDVSAIADRCSSSQGNIFKWDDLKNNSSVNLKFICEPYCT